MNRKRVFCMTVLLQTCVGGLENWLNVSGAGHSEFKWRQFEDDVILWALRW